MGRSSKESRPRQAVDGGGAVWTDAVSDRSAYIDAEVEKSSGRDDSPTGMIKQGRSPLEAKRTKKQQRDLRIQLSDAGISETKNSARDKVRLRQIRGKQK